jgi:hypothetical protein
MPEVILCRYCKQSINKEADQYVVIEKGSDRRPETLAHVACEQKNPNAFGPRRLATEIAMAPSSLIGP